MIKESIIAAFIICTEDAASNQSVCAVIDTSAVETKISRPYWSMSTLDTSKQAIVHVPYVLKSSNANQQIQWQVIGTEGSK